MVDEVREAVGSGLEADLLVELAVLKRNPDKLAYMVHERQVLDLVEAAPVGLVSQVQHGQHLTAAHQRHHDA